MKTSNGRVVNVNLQRLKGIGRLSPRFSFTDVIICHAIISLAGLLYKPPVFFFFLLISFSYALNFAEGI